MSDFNARRMDLIRDVCLVQHGVVRLVCVKTIKLCMHTDSSSALHATLPCRVLSISPHLTRSICFPQLSGVMSARGVDVPRTRTQEPALAWTYGTVRARALAG